MRTDTYNKILNKLRFYIEMQDFESLFDKFRRKLPSIVLLYLYSAYDSFYVLFFEHLFQLSLTSVLIWTKKQSWERQGKA